MSGIPANELKILIAKAAGRCAFRGCGKMLVTTSLEGADPVFSGEACHIIAQSRQGPRGNLIVTEGQRDHHTNLVLMCQEHHLLIDRRPEVYSVGVLRTLKEQHEKNVSALDSRALPAPKMQDEILRSTCFEVTQMPGFEEVRNNPHHSHPAGSARANGRKNGKRHTNSHLPQTQLKLAIAVQQRRLGQAKLKQTREKLRRSPKREPGIEG